MKKMKLVVVGNGMAGIRTLEELLKLTSNMYDITVFGAEARYLDRTVHYIERASLDHVKQRVVQDEVIHSMAHWQSFLV